MLDKRNEWGLGLHSGLRKACDSPQANLLWHMIKSDVFDAAWIALVIHCGERWAQGEDPVLAMAQWADEKASRGSDVQHIMSLVIKSLTIEDVRRLQGWMKDQSQS